MIYVGIDISKYKHDCHIRNDFGDVLNEGFTFANNAGGFCEFQRELERAKSSDEVRMNRLY
jgi:transposase